MMKGYLTIFLAMSLSIFTGFILFLTTCAIRNGEKIRFECASDTAMNAVLSEFHVNLFERYGLLYVDASYLGENPGIEEVEKRIFYYMEKNTSSVMRKKNAPWGQLAVTHVEIPFFSTAAADEGASMRHQAVLWVQDSGIVKKESDVTDYRTQINDLNEEDPFGAWQGIMEQIAGMELPRILNEEGEWEEVPLSNPADWVYCLLESDAFYLGEVDMQQISPVGIDLNQYITHRQIENITASNRIYQKEEKQFFAYLFEKMGYYGNPKEGSLLCCQIEYLAEGKDSDLENMKAVTDRLLRWRFADNVSLALSDGNLREQAFVAAKDLQAVILKNEFEIPVAESILYACAFLESIADLRTIYAGGSIPLRKIDHQMEVDKVLAGIMYHSDGIEGFSYGEYLAGMLLLLEDEILQLRAMDIMEMDIRLQNGNAGFCMDWCIESFEAQISVEGSAGGIYQIRRRYGYF